MQVVVRICNRANAGLILVSKFDIYLVYFKNWGDQNLKNIYSYALLSCVLKLRPEKRWMLIEVEHFFSHFEIMCLRCEIMFYETRDTSKLKRKILKIFWRTFCAKCSIGFMWKKFMFFFTKNHFIITQCSICYNLLDHHIIQKVAENASSSVELSLLYRR